MRLEGGDHRGGGKQKDPRIPQIPPLSQHRQRPGGVGLFDKPRQGLRRIRQRISARGQPQIAIAGLGSGGHDAESHDLPGHGLRQGRRHCRPKAFGIRDHMIRGQHQHHRRGIPVRQPQRRRQDRRGRVAHLRLDQNAPRRHPGSGHLIGDNETEIIRRQHQRRREPGTRHPLQRGAEQRLGARQRRKLFGVALA